MSDLPATANSRYLPTAKGAGACPLAGVQGVEGLDPRANAQAMDTVRLPQIVIVHASQLFQLPAGNTSKTFVGRIVDTHKTRAWWEQDIEAGGGQVPDCSSSDGVVPSRDWSPQIQADTCATCQYAKRGSNRKEGSKTADCRLMRRLHILVPGNDLPCRLTLSVSSFSAWDAYLSELTNRKSAYALEATQFGLVKGPRTGLAYSVLTFAPVPDTGLTQDEAVALVAYIAEWRPLMRRQRVEIDETGQGTAAAEPVDEFVDPATGQERF